MPKHKPMKRNAAAKYSVRMFCLLIHLRKSTAENKRDISEGGVIAAIAVISSISTYKY